MCVMLGAMVQLQMYVNDKRFFVLQVNLQGIESERGLAAYMALLLTGHSLVRSFQLTKVVQHWGITPGDGHIYYASAISQLCTTYALMSSL